MTTTDGEVECTKVVMNDVDHKENCYLSSDVTYETYINALAVGTIDKTNEKYTFSFGVDNDSKTHSELVAVTIDTANSKYSVTGETIVDETYGITTTTENFEFEFSSNGTTFYVIDITKAE